MAYFNGFYSILAAGTALTTSRFSGGWPNKTERLLNSQQGNPVRVIPSGNDRQTSDRGVELLPSWAGMRTDAALLEFSAYDSDSTIFPGGIGNPYRYSPPEDWLPGDLGAKLARWFRGSTGMLQTCGWSQDDKHSNISVSNEFGLTFNSSGWRNARGSFGRSSGKYYLEFKVNGSSPTHGVGLATASAPLDSSHIGVSPHGILILCAPAMYGQVFTNNTLAADYWTTSPVANMTVQLAVDLTAKKVWAKKVGDSLWNNNGSADPVTGVGGYDISTISGMVYPAWSVSSSDSTVVLNPGVYAWAGAMPSGFSAWSSELLVPITDNQRITKWVDQSDNTVPRRLDSYVKHADMTVTTDGLGVSRTGIAQGGGSPVAVRGYEAMPSTGKHYFEYTVGGGSANLSVGFTDTIGVNFASSFNPGQANSYSIGYWSIDGTVKINGTTAATLLAYTTADVIGVAVDFDAKLIWFRKNAGGDWNNNPANNPATGVGGISFASVYTKAMHHAVGIISYTSVVTFNFGATSYSGTAPAGFSNVPNPKASINQATINKRPKKIGQVPDTISGVGQFRAALFDHSLSNTMYGDSYGLPVTTEARSIFLVCLPTSINTEMVALSYGGTSAGEFGLSLTPGGNVGSIQFTSGVTNGRRDITAPIQLKPFIFGFTYDTAADISSANAKLFLNDKELLTTKTSGGSGTGILNTTANTPLFIASRNDESPYARLYIAEMIIVDGLVTQDEKARIEAYLANEYDIQYNIGGHYYKSSEPEEEIENLFPNNSFAGATVGVLGSGGALPTGFSVNWGSQTTEVISITEDNGVAKMRVAVTASNSTGAAVYPGIKCPIAEGISPGAYGFQWKYGRVSKSGSSTLTESVSFKCKDASNAFISDAYLDTYSVLDTTIFSKASRMAVLPVGSDSLDFTVATQLNNSQDIIWVFDISAIQVEREALSDKLIVTSSGAEVDTGMWTPAKFGADNLAWFTAKDRGNLALVSNGVDKWVSRSGTVLATQTTDNLRPEYREVGLDGNPSLYFNSDMLTISQGITAWPTGAAADEITIVLLGRPHSAGAGSTRTAVYYGDSSETGRLSVSANHVGAVTIDNGSSTQTHTNTTWLDKTSLVIVEAGRYMASYKDGVPLRSANIEWLATSTKYGSIGRDNSSRWWVGDISEILVIGRRITAEERAKLEIYAALQWDIRSNLYGDHYTNLVAIIDGLRDSNPNIDITLQNMNPMGAGAGRSLLNSMYELDRDIAIAKNCRFLDNYSAWIEFLGADTLSSGNSIGGDVTHPVETLIDEVLIPNQYKHFSNVLAGTIEIGNLRFLAGQLFIGNYVVAEPVIHGARQPATVTIVDGTLPPGLSFTPAGQLVGILTTAGSYAFTVECTDFSGATVSKEFNLVVGTVSVELTTRPATVSTATSGNLVKPSGLAVGDVVFVVAEYTGSSGLTVQTSGGDVWGKQIFLWPTLGYYSSINWKVITSTDLSNNWTYSGNNGYRLHVAGFDVNGAVINGFNVRYFGGTTGNANELTMSGFVKEAGSKFLFATVVDRDNNDSITLPTDWTRYDDSLMGGSTFTTRAAYIASSSYVNGAGVTFGSLQMTYDQIGFLIEVY